MSLPPDEIPDPDPAPGAPDPGRRTFLRGAARMAMGTCLVAGYGTFAGMVGVFLYPGEPGRESWVFVREVSRFPVGSSVPFRTPRGESVLVLRRGEGETGTDFLALGSTCPHLGCAVHWEPHHDRFFCPCHNGVFDPGGQGISGPPAGLSLPAFPLRVENRLLYILVRMPETL